MSWLWQQSECSDLSCVFPSVQAVINGCVLIVFTHRGQTEPHPAIQHKHCIPPNPLVAHRPETRTSTEVWGVFRPGGQRWCVCVADFPVGRAPSQLDITLTENKPQQGLTAAYAVWTGTTDWQKGFPITHQGPDSSHLVSWPIVTSEVKPQITTKTNTYCVYSLNILMGGIPRITHLMKKCF